MLGLGTFNGLRNSFGLKLVGENNSGLFGTYEVVGPGLLDPIASTKCGGARQKHDIEDREAERGPNLAWIWCQWFR